MSNIVSRAIVGLLCPLLLITGCSEVAQGEKTKSAMCSSDVTCDGDRVRYAGVDLPRIGFLVDGQLTCCMESAQRLAKGDPSKIAYVVAGKKCKNLEEAQTARLKVLEEYYADVLTIKHDADKPMPYRLAAFGFKTEDEAQKAATSARAAADKVTMPSVVGEQATPDETVAKTRLIEAKITTAFEVLMKATEG
ncbi:MAG: hypothetical protein ABII12_07060 [Planctomycetota bacterium]